MDWEIVGALIISVFLIPTAYAGFIGAPWAPTRMNSVKKAFDDMEVGEKDLVVDLGAGNGAIIREAAKRGAHGVGYELSPIMWIVGILNTLKQKGARMVYGNFFKKVLPKKTTIVFLFLMPKNMNQVGGYLSKQPIDNKTLVLSYAFPFTEVKSMNTFREKNCAPLYLYEMSALRAYFDNLDA